MPPGVYELRSYSENPNARAAKDGNAVLGDMRLQITGSVAEIDLGTIELVVDPPR